MTAHDDLALLTDAARAAGDIAMRYWKKSPETWEKDAGAGPVTEADLAVNAML
ncbi:MAG: 3'(2'),5'-bisphosphate nucleotidase CysQ, partial [Albidovulum sp.]